MQGALGITDEDVAQVVGEWLREQEADAEAEAKRKEVAARSAASDVAMDDELVLPRAQVVQKFKLTGTEIRAVMQDGLTSGAIALKSNPSVIYNIISVENAHVTLHRQQS